jgi:hypothetical protein
MAKKQTRRSISVSRTTYERLKAFCETNSMSMSQLVETRVNDFLGTSTTSIGDSAPLTPVPVRPIAPRPTAPMHTMSPSIAASRPMEPRPTAPITSPASATSSHSTAPGTATSAQPTSSQPPMTSAAARFAVEPPLPIIKPRQDTAAPKPAEKRPEQIFTF